MNPKISVVMTVFNGERFIKDAIDSILNQTFTDFEFIIVDNASTDRTKKIISSYKDTRIVLIENKENLGQTKALNVGINRSRGQFIARMDADEISLPQRLELQYKYLLENESVAVVGTWYEKIDENGKHLKYFPEPTEPLKIKCFLISPGLLGYHCIAHPSVLIRRDVFSEVGLYDESYRTQDYELWVRIVRKYKIANLGEFLVKHRLSKKQQSIEFKSEIESDCKRIVNSNIRYYMPTLKEEEIMSLELMLQYKPQKSKKEGLKVLENFDIFFDRYIGDERQNALVQSAKNKMVLFYLLQLFKTNPVYSLKKIITLIFKNPEILFQIKFYKKIARAILTG